MDLHGQLSVLRARLRVILACVAVALVAALAVSAILPRVYEGRATLIVGQSLTSANPDINQISASQRLSQTYAQIATTRPILEAVIARLQLPETPDELLDVVSAEAQPESALFTITARDGDAARAAAIVNAMADELIAVSPTLQGQQGDEDAFVASELKATRTQIETTVAEIGKLLEADPRTADQEARLAVLQPQLVTLRATYTELLAIATNSSTNHLTVVEPAVAAAEPVSPRVPFNLALALIVGLVVAVGLVFLLEYLDDAIKTPEAAEAVTRLPVLGVVPRVAADGNRHRLYDVMTLVSPRSAGAEAFRVLRTNLEFTDLDAPLRRILVTSALPGEGKTTVAANLAAAIAQAGRRVILVDADLRRPEVHTLFRLNNDAGVTTLIRQTDVRVTDALQATEEPKLRVLSAGPPPPNPAEVLGSTRMRTLLDSLANLADVLVLDSPPIQLVTDAALLALAVDGTLLVVDAGHTPRAAARGARDALTRVGARIVGVAFNRSTAASTTDHYYTFYPTVAQAAEPANPVRLDEAPRAKAR